MSLRRDGSSKFKLPENRWGTFWSVGGGWRISDESFMTGAKNVWLDDLKIRASFGEIGNQNGIGYYSGYQTWGLGTPSRNYSGTSWSPQGYTLSQGAWANDGLTWEVVAIVDAGVDFRLWKRFYGSVDWYQRTTKNAIWNEPIAYSLGQASLQKNSAQIRNAGIEFDLHYDVIKTKDFLWSIALNGTHYRTTVVSVPPGTGSEELNGNWIADDSGWSAAGTGSTSGGYYLRGVGKDFYNTYLYIYGGVDQKTGLPLYKAYLTQSDIDQYNATPKDLAYADVLDSKGQVRQIGTDFYTTSRSLAKRYENGSAVPKFIGGFSTTLAFKGFDLNALLSFQLGGKFLSVQYANGLYQGNHTIGGVVSRDLKGNTWTPENTGAKFPMQMYTGETYSGGATLGSWMYTDMAQFSASYLSVKNIAIGYTLPKKTLAKVLFVESLRFYGSVDNMWVFSAKSGVDPRMSLIGGLDVGAFTYPYMRTMNLGVNIVF